MRMPVFTHDSKIILYLYFNDPDQTGIEARHDAEPDGPGCNHIRRAVVVDDVAEGGDFADEAVR